MQYPILYFNIQNLDLSQIKLNKNCLYKMNEIYLVTHLLQVDASWSGSISL